jgi:subtilisin family serine protease
VQGVTDHEEFQDMESGTTRLATERHASESAKMNEGQACAADHGTHVASLAAGFEMGAAKAAKIVSGAQTAPASVACALSCCSADVLPLASNLDSHNRNTTSCLDMMMLTQMWAAAVAVQPGCGQSGYASELEEGLDWVLDQHLAQAEPRKPSVVSMSLIVAKSSSSSELVAEKVEELIENGVIVVAAAGNFHEGLPPTICRSLIQYWADVRA